MSLLQMCCLILTTYIHRCTSATLQKTIQSSGEIWLQQSGTDIYPTWNTSYNTIQLGQVMSIEFDFVFHGRSNDCNSCGPPSRDGHQENFFRIGHVASNSPSNCNGEKSSYPAMFLASSSKGDILDIKVSSGATCGTSNYLTDYGTLNTAVNHHIKISLNNTQVSVEITGGNKSAYTQQWSRQPTPKTYLGNSVNVYFLSNTFYTTPYNRGDATFNNIIIKSRWFTFAPTLAPTLPSQPPTVYPSIAPNDAFDENKFDKNDDEEQIMLMIYCVSGLFVLITLCFTGYKYRSCFKNQNTAVEIIQKNQVDKLQTTTDIIITDEINKNVVDEKNKHQEEKQLDAYDTVVQINENNAETKGPLENTDVIENNVDGDEFVVIGDDEFETLQ